MRKEVKDYHVMFYGSEIGYNDYRAQIMLSGLAGNTIAFIRFIDEGMEFKQDYEDDQIVRMHLPSNMFHNVLDVLRNEKPVYIMYRVGRGFLSTSKEPVGEGE